MSKSAFSIQNTLAILITIGFFGVFGAWMYLPPHAENVGALATLNQLTGAIVVAFAGIVSYFFGSSSGSKEKDDTIKNMKTSQNSTDTTVTTTTPPTVTTTTEPAHTPPAAP